MWCVRRYPVVSSTVIKFTKYKELRNGNKNLVSKTCNRGGERGRGKERGKEGERGGEEAGKCESDLQSMRLTLEA